MWTAADGRETVNLCRAHARDIAVVLLEVHMPVHDLPEAFVTLRQDDPFIDCSIMTASLAGNWEAQLLSLGAAAIFEKPLLLLEATAVISKIIDKSTK